MAIIDDVSSQMKEAMKARDKVRLGALRSIRAALIEAMKADGADTVSDDAALKLLAKQAKQRKESIAAYEEGGRQELADQEKAELAVIEGFLPQVADAAQTEAWVDAAIEQTGAESMRDMGKVMGVLKKTHGAALDGGLASGIVKKKLG